MSETTRIAVIGDLHGFWDDWDAQYFGATAYDLLLFTGDLGSGTGSDGVRIARSIGRLAKPALVMPGNNDVSAAAQIAAELGHQRGLLSLLKLGGRAHGGRSGDVHLAGYGLHRYDFDGRPLTVVSARPYAKGGGELSSPEQLHERYAIASIEESTRALCALIDRVETPGLILLAHNGPAGLGDRATDLWGRDFGGQEGDWGDPDVRAAIVHARRRDKRVIALVGGHMHSPTRTGAARTWQASRDHTLYVNAARVPRIFEREDGKYRHHVAIEIVEGRASARELLVREPD